MMRGAEHPSMGRKHSYAFHGCIRLDTVIYGPAKRSVCILQRITTAHSTTLNPHPRQSRTSPPSLLLDLVVCLRMSSGRAFSLLCGQTRSPPFTDLNPNEPIPFDSVRSSGEKRARGRSSTSAALDRWMRRLPSPRTCATPNILVSPHDPQTHGPTHGHVPTWNFIRVGRR
jgi:hypothetical protein